MSQDRIKKEKLSLQYVDINKLSPFKGNPRKISDKGLEILGKSVSHYGITNPILAWKNPKKPGKYEILAGHQRLKIFEKEKIKQVPIIVLDIKDWHEAYSYLLMDNKSQDYSEFDFPMLVDLITEIDDGSFGDLELTGFDMSEIEELMNWTPKEEEPFDAAAEADKIKEPKSKRGEIYQLGRHRLMCGDATSKEDVERLMGGEKLGLCFTSPPYSDQRTYGGDKDLSNKHLATFIPVACDFVDFLCVNLGIKRKSGEIIEYWQEYIEAAKKIQMKIVSWNVWDKGRGGSVGSMTAMFPIEHEWVFVFGHKSKHLIPIIPNATAGEKTRARVMSRDGIYGESKSRVKRDFGEVGTVIQCRQIDKNDKHPAMFPIELPKQYIKAFDSDCYDPFGGSGTTLIACEQLNRQCRMMEIDEIYCDVIIKRFEQFSGEKAELIK